MKQVSGDEIARAKVYCVVCTTEISADRVKRSGSKAVTCSERCQDTHALIRRRKKTNKACQFCNRPSTPSQRRAWTKLKTWEQKFPELAYPQVYEIVTNAGVTRKDFTRAITQGRKFLVDMRPEMADLGFGARGLDKPRDPTPELDRVLAILTQYQKDHPAAVPSGEGYDGKDD